MVAVKGKLIASRVMEDVTDEIKREVLPVNNGCQATATNSKIRGGLKNIENTRGRNDKSAMRNTERKVLADISNVKGDDLKNALHGGAKPLTTKAKSSMYLQRSSTGKGLTSATSSMRKPLTGNSRVSPSQVSGNLHTGRRDTRDRKDLKVSSGDLRTNSQGRKSFNNVGRIRNCFLRTSLNPRPATRNSLPALKRVNKVDLSEAEKGNAEYMGKIIEKRGFSVKPKVGRKTLPFESSSGSQLTTNQARGFGGQRKVVVSRDSSRKLTKGNSRVSPSQVSGNLHTGRRDTRDRKYLKVSSCDLRTNSQGRKSFNNVGRTSLNPRPATRNSLPVLKRVNKVDLSEAEKGNAEYMGKIIEKRGFSVKPKVGRKTLPFESRSGSQLTTNQARGFGGQRKVVVSRDSSRKLTKSTAKPKVVVADSKITLKKIGAATLSKREDKVLMSSSSMQRLRLVVPSKQPAYDEHASDWNSNIVQSASDAIARKKSGRRRSYTSLLMATSKLLKEQVKITEQDSLPNIDQDCNHLDVAEYVDEIYQYYWVMEVLHQPLQNYMEMQKEITPHMRGILVNWLIEVHEKFDLMQETLYLMVTVLDKYLSLVSIKKNEMQLIGLTSLLLASKYEDFWHPKVVDLISISGESFTRDQMLRMELAVLRKLKFKLNSPTPYVFMLRFLKAAQSDTKFEHLAFYLIELSLVEYEAVDFKPSLLCASAIYLARCTLQMTPAWTPLLCKHAKYEELQVRDCAKNLLRYQKAAKQGVFKVTYQKFMRPDYSKVAAIKPLDRLPL